MTWARFIAAYIGTWLGVELCRPFFGLTQLLYAHELLLSGACIAGGVVVSLAVMEWTEAGQ